MSTPPHPPVRVEAFACETADGIVLRGQWMKRQAPWLRSSGGDDLELSGAGRQSSIGIPHANGVRHGPTGMEYVVVLAHAPGVDRDLVAWRTLWPALLNREITVLAFDLRGHGLSDGVIDPQRIVDDVSAVLTWTRGQGSGRVAVIAEEESALAILRSADRLRVDAFVLLSLPVATNAEPRIRGAGESKLLIDGVADPERRRSLERFTNAAMGWTTAVSFATDESGANLLEGRWGDHVRERIAAFIGERRMLARVERTAGPAGAGSNRGGKDRR